MKTTYLLLSLLMLWSCQATNVTSPSSPKTTASKSTGSNTTSSDLLVSLNRPTSASSQYSSAYLPSVAVDGVLENPTYYTWWSSTYGSNQWLQVDLAQSYRLSRIRLYLGKPTAHDPNHVTYAKNFQLQVQQNGSWVTVISQANNTSMEREYSLTNVTSDKVRFVCNYTDYCRLREIQVYAVENQLPVASAGADRLIHLPTNSLILNGNGSDQDGTIAIYQWSKVSGGNAVLSNANTKDLSLQGLVAGNYVFKLVVTDDQGDSAEDSVNVIVNTPPVANAGQDKSIELPVNQVSLNGSGSDADGSISSYAWSKVSGGAASLSGASSASLNVSGLVEGDYVFRLTVTDNRGATHSDNVSVHVAPEPVSETILSEDKPIVASSLYDSNYPASYANDGTIEGSGNFAWWASAHGSNQYIEIDLGETFALTRAKVHLGKLLSHDPSGSTIASAYQIQIQSGSQWNAVATVTGNNQREREHILSNVSARKVRFVCTQTTICRVREFQIYGLASGPVPNHAPVLAAIQNQSFYEGTSKSLPLSASDEDGDVLEFSLVGSVPSAITLQNGSNGQATLNLSSQLNVGNYSVTVKVSDGTDFDSQAVSITVLEEPVDPDPEPELPAGGWQEPAMPSQTLACTITANGCSEILGNGSGSIWVDARNHPTSRYAGKTLCIRNGNYAGIWFEGLKATEAAPVKIINCGGQVVTKTTNYQTAFSFGGYSRYIHLTGTGSASHRYGIVSWAAGTGNMLDIGGGSSDVTVEQLEIRGNDSQGNPSALTGGVGIAYRTYPVCSSGEFSANNFAIHNVNLKNNYIHDTKYEGMYIGQSHYGSVSAGSLGVGWPCSGFNIEEAPVLGSDVVNNRIERTGNDAYQIAGAINGFLFQSNYIKNFGLNNTDSHSGGIQIGTGSKGLVKNNWVETEVARYTQGLKHAGTGDTYYVNNIVKGVRHGIMLLRNTDVNIGANIPNVYFYHNTLVNSANLPLIYWCSLNKNVLFANNIVAGYSGSAHGAGGPGGTTCFDQTLFNSFNGFYPSASSAGFVNSGTGNFHLNANSPAVNVGKTLTEDEVEKDFDGVTRTGSAFDLGAFAK